MYECFIRRGVINFVGTALGGSACFLHKTNQEIYGFGNISEDKSENQSPLTRHVGCGCITEIERFLVDRWLLRETELVGSSACKEDLDPVSLFL